MEAPSDVPESGVKTEDELKSTGGEKVETENEADQHNGSQDESGSQAGSEASQESPGPPPVRPKILMICLPGLSTEYPVVHSNSTMESVANVGTFYFKPERFLGEKGLIDNLDNIVTELLDFVLTVPKDFGLTLEDLSIGFMGPDFGGTLVKRVIAKPVFFGTPHQASESISWERVLSQIIEDGYRGVRGPWFPSRICQLASYMQKVQSDFDEILGKFKIVNYYQDLDESSPESLIVDKSCAVLEGFNVTNIGMNVSHYELHCWMNEVPGEDFLVDKIRDTVLYSNVHLSVLLELLSLESDGIETDFRATGYLDNLAGYIVNFEELAAHIHTDQAQLISLEIQPEVDSKRFLSSFSSAICRALPPYPGVITACSSITPMEPLSLTESGLLSNFLSQVLKQYPASSGWLNNIYGRVLYSLRMRYTELTVQTLRECLRLVFTHSFGYRGFWVIHTTGTPDERQLLQRIVNGLQYFHELDEIGWKIIIIGNSVSEVDFPSSSKAYSSIKLDQDSLRDSMKKDMESQVDQIIRLKPHIADTKEKILQELNKPQWNPKLSELFIDALRHISPSPPAVLFELMKSFSSTEAAFKTIFEQVPENYRVWVRKVLTFVCFSLRPLTPDELAIAVAAVDCKSFEEIREVIDHKIAESIQQLLPGLIRIQSGRVSAAHDGLKSFLTQCSEDAWYHLNNCHSTIALACYKYLSVAVGVFGVEKTSPLDIVITKDYLYRSKPGPFRGSLPKERLLLFSTYAALYWCDHYLSPEDGNANSHFEPWSTDTPLLIKILALRRWCRSPYTRDDEPTPREFMPSHLREEFKLSELDVFKMTLEMVDHREGDSLIDIIYPSQLPEDETTRDWISTNFPMPSVSWIGTCQPQILDRIFQREKELILNHVSAVVASIVARNDLSLLAKFLGKLSEEQVNMGEATSQALTYAIFWSLIDIVKIILDHQVKPIGPLRSAPWSLTVLHVATAAGDTQIIQLLLDAGADVNAVDAECFILRHATPLHVACQFGFTEVVRLLLGAHADVKYATPTGITALHIASTRGFPSICELLISHEATLTLDQVMQSPLHIPAKFSWRPRYKKIAAMLLGALKKQYPRYKESGSQDAEDIARIINAQAGDKKKTALIYATVAGDVDLAKSLIDLGADVHAAEDDNFTAMSRAAMVDNVDMIRLLLNNGEVVDQTRDDGRQALHDACAWGSTNAIKELLERNAPPDYLDNDKIPPISVGAIWGLLRAVKQMVPRSSRESKSLALISAARYGYYEIVTALLDAGANINYQDEYGNTALQFSCWNSNSRVTQLLLSRVPDVDRADNDNFTALTDAARRGATECLKLLLDAGANPEIESISGKRPLIRAADADDECFRLLLDRGAMAVLPNSIEKPNNHMFNAGVSFLDELVLEFTVSVVRIYLDHLKASVSEDVFSSEFNEALATAAYTPKLDSLELLLECGADPNAMISKFDEQYGSAIGVAVAYNNMDAVQILLDKASKPVDLNKVDDYRDTPLHIALYMCQANVKMSMLKLLLDNGADPTISSGSYGTVLNCTSVVQSDDVVDLILGQPGVSRDAADEQGRLPIHLAALETKTVERVNKMTTKTSTVRSQDKQGRNVLHHAAAGGSIAVVERILKDCPDLVNVSDNDGWTPLHWACRRRVVEVTRCLIKHGANRDAKTRDGWTPRHVAIYHNNLDYLELPPEEGDASDEEELPSEAAEQITDTLCEACICEICGTGYRCGSCPKFWFCFKCYWSSEDTHPKDHVFQRFDQETGDAAAGSSHGSNGTREE
ncbi:hypothetical protein AAE478_001126 [Parahypoxylon ruwenzoriense]